jgi:hypothetical protein
MRWLRSALLIGLFACKAKTAPVDAAPPVVTGEITGVPDTMRELETITLSASVPNATWQVSSPRVARVDGAKLTALHAGTVVVSAYAGEQSFASKELEVRPVLDGEWERETEPYKGLRMSIPSGRITRVPVVTDERLAARGGNARGKAELDCQSASWHTGETYLSDLASDGPKAYRARAVVRDWGLAPNCQHRDASGAAHIDVMDSRTLDMMVTRQGSKTPVTQRWSRVGE